MLVDGEQRLLFYQPVVFSIVGEWLACVAENVEADAASLLKRSIAISPVLHDFLVQSGFAVTWDNLKKNNRSRSALMKSFHGWFDAFRTMRLIHELSDKAYPRIAPEEAVAPLFEGSDSVGSDTSISGRLELLRTLQGVTVIPAGSNLCR
jgi:hypothetical protein